MTASRKKLARRGDYNDQEKKVLLDGVPLTHLSTRFGHRRHGWHLEEIRIAWDLLKEELMPLWESDEHPYSHHHERHDRPWAERILNDDD